METQIGPTATDITPEQAKLLQAFTEQCRGYSFFQMVWLIHKIFPGASAVGGSGPFSKEPIRFRANASLAFPISDVESLSQDEKFHRLLMTVNFMGLYGPASPMPAHFTENIVCYDPEHHDVRHFLDMFHHRFISLLYRAWQKYRYFFVYKEGGQDYFSNWMFALIGVGDPKLRKFSSIQWIKLLPFINLLSVRSHSADTLKAILSKYFGGTQVGIEECIGKMVHIDESQQNQVGVLNATLGQNCLLGSKVFDRSSSFKLVLGPMDYEHYRYFLPHGRYHRPLRELVRFVLNDPLAFDVELVLKGGQIPQLRLQHNNSCQLGGSAWLGERLVEEMVINQIGYT